MKKVLQIENIKTIGTVYSDELICRRLGIEIPTLVPSDRVAATKILSNFQTKKAFAINSANKVLRLAGVQLAQKSHTEYLVVSVEAKKARLTAQTNRFAAALARF